MRFPGNKGHGALGFRHSALQASIAGKIVYSDLIEAVAAYLFYLCKNHPFLDGNKRTALGACLVFSE